MNLILPMAGHGQRFRDAGHAEEKPLIRVNGKTLLEWSLSCVPNEVSWTLYPVMRSKQWSICMGEALDWLGDPRQEDANVRWNKLYPQFIHGSTPGAACTVLSAALALPPDEPVAAMNCDQWFRCDLKVVTGKALAEGWDGFILTFPGTGPAWSYVITNGENRVLHVIEKAEVSKHATVGFYWWRRAGDLVKSICAMIAADQRTKGEFYLAPSYNFLPLSSKDVRIVPVEAFVGLGTPEQLKAAENSECLVQEP